MPTNDRLGSDRGLHHPATASTILRTVGALILTGLIAPAIFHTTSVALAIAYPVIPFSADEFIGLGLMTLLLGAPLSVGVALVAGLPGILLARRWNLASVWFFGVGGALLALGCVAWFAREEFASWRWSGSFAFPAIAALTGAVCGLLCWFIADVPRPAAPGRRSERLSGA